MLTDNQKNAMTKAGEEIAAGWVKGGPSGVLMDMDYDLSTQADDAFVKGEARKAGINFDDADDQEEAWGCALDGYRTKLQELRDADPSTEFRLMFDDNIKAEEFESRVLSSGREFLPLAVQAVLDGGTKTNSADYWSFLVTQKEIADEQEAMDLQEAGSDWTYDGE